MEGPCQASGMNDRRMDQIIRALTMSLTVVATVSNLGGETLMAQSQKPIWGIRQILVLTERERMGVVTHRLRADVRERLVSDGNDEVELRAGTEIEDDRVRDRLLVVFPAHPVNRLDGSFVLSLGTPDAQPVATRRAEAIERDGRVSVRLDVKSGAAVDGWWSYSRQPAMRRVLLPSFDDPAAPVDAMVFHATDAERSLVPVRLATDGEWTRLSFELPPELLEESRLLDGCERLVEALDLRGGGSRLEWPEGLLSVEVLDAVATELEHQVLPRDRQFNITLEVATRETTRGKRLQPLVRYPVTVIGRDGNRLAATLACSISGR